MSVLLGCVADDFTGATDLCNTLVKGGMRTVQLFGVPDGRPVPDDVDAVVVALKSRTAPVADAVQESLSALAWLRHAGCRRFLFKYCSTFDSTPEGNIGPVADAMLDALGGSTTIFCPAFPETGRTICHGHLFVGEQLLSDSGMKDHPLTPMTDSSLVRWLGRQTPHGVGLVSYRTVREGPDAIHARMAALAKDGVRHVVVDALSDEDLHAIARGTEGLRLITGGSGIALGLPDLFRREGLLPAERVADALPAIDGRSAVLSGSCSQAPLGQVEGMNERRPALRLGPLALARGQTGAEAAVEWATARMADGPVLVYASATPDEVRAAQAELGRERAGAVVEQAMARVATGLVHHGVRRLVVAGGETSGAVVQALGVTGIRIGPQIDPGVPWTASLNEPPLALALKSGNFGARDFFLKAFERQ